MFFSKVIPQRRAMCQAARSYATITGQLTPEEVARKALAAPKLSQRGNPVDLRRQYLFQQYKSLLGSRAVFVMQQHNLTSQEYSAVKNDFREKGFIVTTVRNNIFGAVIREHVSASKEVELRKMRELFVGPCSVAFSNAGDAEQPALAKDFADVAARHKAKLLVVGAKFEGSLLTADTLKQIIALPSLGQLRAELVGLLSQPGQALLGMLQRTPQSLLTALSQHETALKGDGKEDAPPSA
ncbi:hypothetical protein HDU89_001950 [Geranomyces variabilis]|nr:hypothetical protein HDU89_001950 [Geranomyces variabilis]